MFKLEHWLKFLKDRAAVSMTSVASANHLVVADVANDGFAYGEMVLGQARFLAGDTRSASILWKQRYSHSLHLLGFDFEVCGVASRFEWDSVSDPCGRQTP